MKVKKHPSVTTPHGNSSVWRYMPLEKFLDVVVNRRLFFTNAERMTDRFEATMPSRNLKALRRELAEEYAETPEEVELRLGYEQFQLESLRRLTLLNCWSLGDHESYALWKIYLSGARAGVAIRSTVGRLRRAIEGGGDEFPEDVYFGEVTYSDYLAERELDRFALITRKAPSYSYEKELRLFIAHYPRSEGGGSVPYSLEVGRHVAVDVDELVGRIYLSPFAGSWFGNVFQRVLERVAPSLTSRVRSSLIDDQ